MNWWLGHSILTVRCHEDQHLRKEILEDAIMVYHRLAEYGKEVGLRALAYEMTSVLRETAATFNDWETAITKIKVIC